MSELPHSKHEIGELGRHSFRKPDFAGAGAG